MKKVLSKYWRKMFPSEFDYEDLFTRYYFIGEEKGIKDKSKYCKDFATWRKVFKTAYNNINDKDSKAQLFWAFREHLRSVKAAKEYIIGIAMVVYIAMITFYQPAIDIMIYMTNNTYHVIRDQTIEMWGSIVSVIFLLFYSYLAGKRHNRNVNLINFDEEAIRILKDDNNPTEQKGPKPKAN